MVQFKVSLSNIIRRERLVCHQSYTDCCKFLCCALCNFLRTPVQLSIAKSLTVFRHNFLLFLMWLPAVITLAFWSHKGWRNHTAAIPGTTNTFLATVASLLLLHRSLLHQADTTHNYARLLIVQCSRLVFVCIYIYPSHFNCVEAVSVVSSPYYKPRSTGLTMKRSRRDRARVKMEQARATWSSTWYWSD